MTETCIGDNRRARRDRRARCKALPLVVVEQGMAIWTNCRAVVVSSFVGVSTASTGDGSVFSISTTSSPLSSANSRRKRSKSASYSFVSSSL